MSKQIVILLHGVGSNGADLQGLGDFWAESFPGLTCIAPDAPFPCDMGSGYQWFSVNGVTDENRPARIAEARTSFDAALQKIFSQYGITPEDEVVLTGFSQGSIMALDALARAAFPLAGVIAFSGRLASPPPLHPAPGSKVLLIHGQDDQVIPWTESRHAEQQLTAAGVEVTSFYQPGVPHTISGEGVAEATDFIQQCFDLPDDE
ncbi:dienelactone hydrolase family protein [Tatumella terrea]|uniref:alpha/beta hydrolase n=1 Tax=Tatumella TaxID=82986 RepID=UPI001BAFC8B3|nr:dienelactone hydrolase family protein [Tatumella sp. JGM118]MBS0908619.1 dienelactone hydrolase family protein [Tatumella sp. JGM118]